MAEPFDVSVNYDQAPGEDYFRRQAQTMDEAGALVVQGGHPMDSDAAREVHRKLLNWFWYEKDKQATNRLDMAMDNDFYDNLQWTAEDAQVLRDRGQMPLVYNEIAPMVDWIIGTERRSRVDWRVLPRAQDDVDMADVKTKVLKYVSDVNRVAFTRSRAFSDAIKVGVGWLDDGVRDDPTQDVIYSRYEDWRCVLWDSNSYELDLSDARYVFRWRWVDEDVAVMMFPDREAKIRAATHDANRAAHVADEDTWYEMDDGSDANVNGTLNAAGSGYMVDAKRNRVRLIECQYREPAAVKVVASGAFKGAIFNPHDEAMGHALGADPGCMLVDKVMMRVHVAVFTEADMLCMGPSVFRHNQFSLTPIWCYRRGRDRMPYGIVRRVRDIQQDLNKRASKALFLLNTNQIIADEGATDDWNLLRDEADRPDGVIVKKQGKELRIQRDTDAATGQIQIMTLDAQSIQKSAGISNENLGRQTNASSGEAIKARQLQGSVVTTEPFDNLRLATQVQGEKQLSLVEQWYTEEKVIRLTGARGAIDWVSINQPEQLPDGSIRYINDITARMADFAVSDQDYAGSLRQVMFDSLNQLASRLPPEVALRLLTIAMDFSDLPNKDEVAETIRRVTGEKDPNKPLTPEEQQQQAQQMQTQQEALQMQREQAMTALEEQRARVREINAKAAKLESEVGGDASGAAAQARVQASQELERVTEALRKAQMELANRTLAIKQEADTRVEVARIEADSRLRVAEIQAASSKRLDAIGNRIDNPGQQKGQGNGKDQEQPGVGA